MHALPSRDVTTTLDGCVRMTGGSSDCVPGSATFDEASHALNIQVGAESWQFRGATPTHSSVNMTHYVLAGGGFVQIYTATSPAGRAASARGSAKASARTPCGCGR